MCYDCKDFLNVWKQNRNNFVMGHKRFFFIKAIDKRATKHVAISDTNRNPSLNNFSIVYFFYIPKMICSYLCLLNRFFEYKIKYIQTLNTD